MTNTNDAFPPAAYVLEGIADMLNTNKTPGSWEPGVLFLKPYDEPGS